MVEGWMQTRRNALPITAELAKDEENKTVLLLPMLSNLHMTDYRLKREQNNLIVVQFHKLSMSFRHLVAASIFDDRILWRSQKQLGKCFFLI